MALQGKELDITGETELVKRLDEIRKQYNLDSIEDLEKAAKEQGVSFEDFKANIRNQIITQEVMRQEVGEHIQMTPGEVERYYEQHKQDYAQPESERLSEILISTGPRAPTIQPKWRQPKPRPTTLRRDCTRAETLRSWREASATAPRRRRAAIWASTSAASLPKVLEDKTFGLKSGQYTDPILTRQGYIILKVVQHTPGGPRPLQGRARGCGTGLLHEPDGTGDSRLSEQDAGSGLHPDQAGILGRRRDAGRMHSSISFSAYVPPAPKKKAKVERTRFRESTHTFREKSGAASPPGPRPLRRKPAHRRQLLHQLATTKKKKKDKKEEAATEKPGKKEKIRFGQAPRETLPSATTNSATEDAGAVPANRDGFECRPAGQSAGADRANRKDALQRARHGSRKQRRQKPRLGKPARQDPCRQTREK